MNQARIGRSANTVESPRDMSIARRKFSSSKSPRTKPGTIGETGEFECREAGAENAEYRGLDDIEQAVLGAEDADADEADRRRVQQPVRHLQPLGPGADHRNDHDHGWDVADREARHPMGKNPCFSSLRVGRTSRIATLTSLGFADMRLTPTRKSVIQNSPIHKAPSPTPS
jgi:hypothetical protein